MTKTETILSIAVAAVAVLVVVVIVNHTPPDPATPAPVGAVAVPAETAADAEGVGAELAALIELAESYTPTTAAKHKATESVIVHVIMAFVGVATIVLVTGDHLVGGWFFPGAARVRRRGERLRERAEEGEEVPWEELESQHRNEAMIAVARILAAGIVLGFTLSG